MGIIPHVVIDLAHTLESGQLFRYFQEDGWWYILNGNKAFRIRLVDAGVEFEGNVDEAFVTHFLGLDHDLSHLAKKYPKDTALKKALKKFPGIRIMRQDPWECIISFLCSSNANIPKIKKNINGMAEHLGSDIQLADKSFKTFPGIGTLSNEEFLREVKTGYRAKFIAQTNALVTEEFIQEVFNAPYALAKELLMQLPGVGDKVSDCILLFGFQKYEAFPVDTWMNKVMMQEYPECALMNPKQIAEFARSRFGEDAGYIQQYLFYLSRAEY